MTNVRALIGSMELGASDVSVSWLPPYHDMGLIGTILEPLAIGAQTILMSPMTFGRSGCLAQNPAVNQR